MSSKTQGCRPYPPAGHGKPTRAASEWFEKPFLSYGLVTDRKPRPLYEAPVANPGPTTYLRCC